MLYNNTNVQYVEMVRTLALCGDNVAEAVRRYNEQFSILVAWNTMLGATQRLRDHGQFKPVAVDSGVAHIPVEVQQQILNYVADNPETSTTQLGRLFNVSQSYMWPTLRDDHLYPSHFRRAQDLLGNDKAQRVLFCEWLLNEDRNILFTDECTTV